MTRAIITSFLWLSPLFSMAASFTSVKNGNWSSRSTWGSNGIPAANINNKDVGHH